MPIVRQSMLARQSPLTLHCVSCGAQSTSHVALLSRHVPPFRQGLEWHASWPTGAVEVAEDVIKVLEVIPAVDVVDVITAVVAVDVTVVCVDDVVLVDVELVVVVCVLVVTLEV